MNDTRVFFRADFAKEWQPLIFLGDEIHDHEAAIKLVKVSGRKNIQLKAKDSIGQTLTWDNF